ncbi:hypothetical protein ETD86_48175 [Nonomuraea turkmeniaca]|uniref:Uncharacterized protein n=1 Tax=Nonomuraea turkmeniaca TaxID=103838 RepID=A0A5S4EXE0_9ACTN|nr:hypothetical protein [Nonomuraea turkmeniaca]TMR08339.1 hypothetical protein ETD86_48175 [Nonomuraea turkmeniaca]
MNDLSAVREHLAAPGPSEETVARGRARLQRLIVDERTARPSRPARSARPARVGRDRARPGAPGLG